MVGSRRPTPVVSQACDKVAAPGTALGIAGEPPGRLGRKAVRGERGGRGRGADVGVWVGVRAPLPGVSRRQWKLCSAAGKLPPMTSAA